MTRRDLTVSLFTLVAGLAIGFLTANYLNRGITETSPSSVSEPSANTATVSIGNRQNDVSATLESADNDPQNFAAQMRAGEMFARIGRFEKAVEYYKRGVLINPSNAQANIVLANALFDSQQFEEAGAYYQKALDIDPDNADVRTDLAATFVERTPADHGRAITELEKVRAVKPDHAPSLYYLGIAKLRTGDAAEAQRILQDLEKKDTGGALTSRLRQNIEAKAAPTR